MNRVYHADVRPLLSRLAVIACALSAAGCPSEERRTFVLTRVVPEVDPSCGAPTGARLTMLTALGDFPAGNTTTYINEEDQPKIEIDSFPDNTTALEIAVFGAGGQTLTIGRTRAFDFTELEDGSEIPVFMGKKRGFCPTGSMGDFRANPLVARADEGVLVAGGLADDEVVPTAEWYDPDRGQFLPVEGTPYGTEAHGLRGASMTELPDGRVAIVGGNIFAYQLYDPSDRSFAARGYLETRRAYHAAAALLDGRVLLIGGCMEVDAAGECVLASGTRNTQILDVDSGELTTGPRLDVVRVGASALAEPDGTVLVFGGVDGAGDPAPGVARLDPIGGAPTETIAGVDGQVAPLLSGGVLAGFAPGADPAAAWVVPPGSAEGSPVHDAPAPRDGATLTALDDGKVFVFGGIEEPGGEETEVVPGALYSPFVETFLGLDPVNLPTTLIPQRAEHAAVLLEDGTVLLLGGRRSDGLALNDAWIYRHDLTGPLTPDVEIILGRTTAQQAELLSPRDPLHAGSVEASNGRPRHYRIEGSGSDSAAISEWVIATGPRFLNPRITARLGASGGGVALFLAYQNPTSYYYVELIEQQPVRLLRVTAENDGAQVICTGDPLADEALEVVDAAPMFQAQAGADSFGVWREGVLLLDCNPEDPIGRGSVGVGVIGGEGAVTVVDDIAAYR